MNFVKTNFTTIIVIVLLCVVILQRCENKPASSAPTIVRDTQWVKKDSVIYTKPSVINTIKITSHDTIINHYIPDTNYNKLVKQYQDVVNQLLAKNIHSDSIRIDTNGYVKITDTVQKNLIVGRSTEYNIKYPVITNTITIHPKQVNQLYVGGGVGLSPAINQLKTGLLLKNKKDQIFGASVAITPQGQLIYGVESYWKIKIKK